MKERQLRIRARNQEIREIWRHLRQVERRQSSYCMEVIQANYHLSEDWIYQIIAQDDEPDLLTSPSIVYQTLLKKIEV